MRIVFFDFNNNFGGGPKGSIDYARWLSAEHEVHVVDAYGRCALYRQAIQEAGLPCHVLLPDCERTYIGGHGPARAWALLRQVPELLRLRARLVRTLRALDPDVIWVMNEKSLTFVGTSRRLRRYPIALRVVGWASPDQVNCRLRWLMRRRVGAVMAVSNATIENLVQAGVPREKLHRQPSPVEMERVLGLAGQPLDCVLPNTDKRPRLLHLAARPERAKGHITAVKAIARLKRAGYDAALWMPGRAPVGVDDSFVRALEALGTELGVRENMFFLGWVRNIPALIRACDIVMLPSHTEGLPRSLLEAMALRRPVVATPVGGIPDCVKDHATGLLFPVDDDEALAARITELLTNPGQREQIVNVAERFVQEKFGHREFTQRMAAVFRALAQAKT